MGFTATEKKIAVFKRRLGDGEILGEANLPLVMGMLDDEIAHALSRITRREEEQAALKDENRLLRVRMDDLVMRSAIPLTSTET